MFQVFTQIYLEGQSHWNNLFTKSSSHFTHSSFPPAIFLWQNTRCKSLWQKKKKLGGWGVSLKMFQLRTVRGPHALVPIKNTGVSLAHYSNWQRNIGEVSAASAGAAVSFHTTWMELPRQPHSCFCVGLGYLPVPARRPPMPKTELEFPL